MEDDSKPTVETKHIGIAVAAVALIGIGLLIYGGQDDEPAPATAVQQTMTAQESMNAATPDEMVYDVSGTAYSAMVTYQTATGTQQATVDLPMQNNAGTRGVRMQGSSIPDFAYISAQNQGETGTITCRITLNGKTISENTSSGAYAIAVCSS